MTKHFHLSNLCTLLIQGFTDKELRRLCYDMPHFRPVYDELARNTGKAAIIDRLLEYAEAKVPLDNLLTLAQKLNPAQFELHQPYYELSSAPIPPTSPSVESDYTSTPRASSTKSEPQIDNPKNLRLPPGADTILKKMFADYWHVVILREFGGGFSGSRIFLVQPQRDPHVAELRAVIKLASRSLIEKEWRAYRNCICDQMPHITKVRGEPVFAESGWGGLGYLLLGSGVFDIESMYSFCRHPSIENIQFALGRLLKVIEPGVRSQANVYTIVVEGGEPRQLISEGFANLIPLWLPLDADEFLARRDTPLQTPPPPTPGPNPNSPNRSKPPTAPRQGCKSVRRRRAAVLANGINTLLARPTLLDSTTGGWNIPPILTTVGIIC